MENVEESSSELTTKAFKAEKKQKETGCRNTVYIIVYRTYWKLYIKRKMEKSLKIIYLSLIVTFLCV